VRPLTRLGMVGETRRKCLRALGRREPGLYTPVAPEVFWLSVERGARAA
jgi:hypothetical protein